MDEAAIEDEMTVKELCRRCDADQEIAFEDRAGAAANPETVIYERAETNRPCSSGFRRYRCNRREWTIHHCRISGHFEFEEARETVPPKPVFSQYPLS